MAVMVYSNGIIENIKPEKFVFSEKELIDLFKEYNIIRSYRIRTMINAWCICGDSYDIYDLNRIATEITEKRINGKALFIHDTEIDPEWNLSDTIIDDYKTFDKKIKNTIEEIAINILEEYERLEDSINYLPFLNTIGTTSDKRILFSFNPDEQSKEFYEDDKFYNFSQKVYKYLSLNSQEKEPFTIYSDKRAIIIIDSNHVKRFLSLMIDEFKSNEDYEICNHISKIMNTWNKKLKNKRKNNSSKDKNNEQ